MQRRIAAALGAPPEDADRVAPLVVITTTGDRVQDRRLLEIGGKGLFTKEIEEALLAGQIDCAIHSLKDMPVASPEGLVLAAIPEREDPRDAFISLTAERLEDLPRGARLGTASLRRQAQCLNLRPDLDVRMLRGNVDTRLEKLRAGEADAILLAASGLNRLGLSDLPRSFIDPRHSPPAPGQGALAIQTREADRDLPWLSALRHAPTALAVSAFFEDDDLVLAVEALSPDGVHRFRGEGRVTASAGPIAAAALGLELGRRIQSDGGALILLPD